MGAMRLSLFAIKKTDVVSAAEVLLALVLDPKRAKLDQKSQFGQGFTPKIPPSFTESIYWYSCMLFWAQIFVYLHVLSLVSYLEILYSESIGLMNLCIEQLIDPI